MTWTAAKPRSKRLLDNAFKQVFEKARPSLLEPVVKLDITVPEANVGDVYSDMSGRVEDAFLAVTPQVVTSPRFHCEVPLREVTTYSRVVVQHDRGIWEAIPWNLVITTSCQATCNRT